MDRFDGKIDIILGESLGGMIMTEILLDERITVVSFRKSSDTAKINPIG